MGRKASSYKKYAKRADFYALAALGGNKNAIKRMKRNARLSKPRKRGKK